MTFRRNNASETDGPFDSLPDDGHQDRTYPDGLDLVAANVLIWAALQEARTAPEPTSALLDGSALERRQRREARRAMASVVRALPTRHVSRQATATDRRAA